MTSNLRNLILFLVSLVPLLILEGTLLPILLHLPSKNPMGGIYMIFSTYSLRSLSQIHSARRSYSTSEEPFPLSISDSPFPMDLRSLLTLITAAMSTKLSELKGLLASSKYPAFRTVGSHLLLLLSPVSYVGLLQHFFHFGILECTTIRSAVSTRFSQNIPT